MDDLTARAVQWCERAARLCEGPTRSGPESLSSLLDAIAAGLLVRRQLDLSELDEAVEKTRRELLRRLIELQLRADALIASLAPGSENHDLVGRRSRAWLDEIRSALRNVSTGAALHPLQRALAI